MLYSVNRFLGKENKAMLSEKELLQKYGITKDEILKSIEDSIDHISKDTEYFGYYNRQILIEKLKVLNLVVYENM